MRREAVSSTPMLEKPPMNTMSRRMGMAGEAGVTAAIDGVPARIADDEGTPDAFEAVSVMQSLGFGAGEHRLFLPRCTSPSAGTMDVVQSIEGVAVDAQVALLLDPLSESPRSGMDGRESVRACRA